MANTKLCKTQLNAILVNGEVRFTGKEIRRYADHNIAKKYQSNNFSKYPSEIFDNEMKSVNSILTNMANGINEYSFISVYFTPEQLHELELLDLLGGRYSPHLFSLNATIMILTKYGATPEHIERALNISLINTKSIKGRIDIKHVYSINNKLETVVPHGKRPNSPESKNLFGISKENCYRISGTTVIKAGTNFLQFSNGMELKFEKAKVRNLNG